MGMESDSCSSSTASVRVDTDGRKQTVNQKTGNRSLNQSSVNSSLGHKCCSNKTQLLSICLPCWFTLQQVVQVECSRAVPLSGRTAEKKKNTSTSQWKFKTQSNRSERCVLHELGLLIQRHSQGCGFDFRQVELPHQERQLEEVLHGDPDPWQTKTRTQTSNTYRYTPPCLQTWQGFHMFIHLLAAHNIIFLNWELCSLSPYLFFYLSKSNVICDMGVTIQFDFNFKINRSRLQKRYSSGFQQ